MSPGDGSLPARSMPNQGFWRIEQVDSSRAETSSDASVIGFAGSDFRPSSSLFAGPIPLPWTWRLRASKKCKRFGSSPSRLCFALRGKSPSERAAAIQIVIFSSATVNGKNLNYEHNKIGNLIDEYGTTRINSVHALRKVRSDATCR